MKQEIAWMQEDQAHLLKIGKDRLRDQEKHIEDAIGDLDHRMWKLLCPYTPFLTLADVGNGTPLEKTARFKKHQKVAARNHKR